MKKFLGAILLGCLVVTVALAISAAAHAQAATKADIVAAITKMENDSVQADMAGDASFYEKALAANWTGGDSDGTFYTKAQMLKMMADKDKNNTKSEMISDLKVRVYGSSVAVATYKDTYDGMFMGKPRARTVISTDTFMKMGGDWKQVASHASQTK